MNREIEPGDIAQFRTGEGPLLFVTEVGESEVTTRYFCSVTGFFNWANFSKQQLKIVEEKIWTVPEAIIES